jgi:single-strand DNA-binding protein
MADVNHTILIGRLTRDAELKYTAGGVAVGKFSIAVNKRVKKGEAWEDKVSFFEIVQWGKSAEALNQYLVKGKQVAVSGELEQDRWEHEGKNMSKVYVTAHNVQLLGGQAGQGSAPVAQAHSVDEAADGGFQDDPVF